MPTPLTKPGTKTPAKVRCRKGPLPEIKPLSSDEYSTLNDLLMDAHSSNLRLAGCGSDLEDARRKLRFIEAELRAAEQCMAEERVRNSNLHTQLAPLLHRLPTV